MAAGRRLRAVILSRLAGPSPPSTKELVKAALGWGAAVGLIVWGLSSLGSVTSVLLGFPSTLMLPLAVKALGWAVILGGTGMALWLFRYRHPIVMIVSTYHTFVRMLTLSPVPRLGVQTEPLVVEGPQRFVRNPLYLGAMMIFLGWGLITAATSSFMGFLFILAWFRFVQIPFEEKELRTRFGEQYLDYESDVPMLLPFSRRRKKHQHSLSSHDAGGVPALSDRNQA